MFVFILLCVLLVVCIRWVRKSVRVEKPPLYSGALPIIGHVHRMIGDSQFFYHRVTSMAEECNEKGGVMLLKIGLDDYYVITDPEDFTTAANQCLKTHFTYKFIQPWLGGGLISGTDVAVWKRHRKLLSPAFSQQVLDGFLHVFNTQSRNMVDKLVQKVGKGPFDHSGDCNHMALEIVLQTSFGVTVDAVENFDTDTYMEAVETYLHNATKRLKQWWLHNDFVYSFTQQKKEENKAVEYLNNVSKAVLAQKVKRKLTGNNGFNETKYKVFMDLALELAERGDLTETEVYQEMNTMIAAGYETSGNALMFTLLLLGSHLEAQQKVYEELQTVFDDQTRDVEKQDLSKLVYLEAVLKESIRFFTITPAMFRTVETDVKLKNYTMPAGSNVFLFICGLHRNPAWGPDADTFRPERWLEGPSSELSKAFAGFGVGKRLCLGQNFSMMSMKTALVHFLRRYHVTSDVSKLVLKIDPLLKAVAGNEISIDLRTTVQKDRQIGS